MIRDLAEQDNITVWLSADRSMAFPSEVPEGCKVAWMMVDENEEVPEGVEVLFRTHQLRKKPLALPLLPVICPTETIEGKRTGIFCATRTRCWKD